MTLPEAVGDEDMDGVLECEGDDDALGLAEALGVIACVSVTV